MRTPIVDLFAVHDSLSKVFACPAATVAVFGINNHVVADKGLVPKQPIPLRWACHYDEPSECAHVSINEVTCYRTERNTDGGTSDAPF